MLEFDKTFKIYLFKDKDTVDWTIKISNSYAHTYTLTKNDMMLFLANWDTEAGYSFNIVNGGGFVQHKKTTPRPESASADYVRITIWSGIQHQYRVNTADMMDLASNFDYQCRNKMFWDD